MQALFALIKVQIRLYLSNRRALLINLALPILIAAFFGMLFGGSGNKDKPISVAVALVDQDRSELSGRIIAALAKDSALKAQTLDLAAAQDLVKRGKLRAALVLPAGFGEKAARALMGGEKAPVQILFDPSDQMALNLLRGLLAQHAMQQVMSNAFTGVQGGKVFDESLAQLDKAEGVPPEQREALSSLFKSVRTVQEQQATASAPQGSGGGMGGMSLPYTLSEQALSSGERGYNGYAHSFAGMGAQFVLFMGVELGVGILMSRRAGLWLRLRAAPLSRFVLLSSYFCSTSLIASCILALVMGAGMLIFGFGVQGSVAGFALVVIAYGLFTAGFGLFLASAGGSPEATRGLSVLATLLMVMLGGAWVPSFIFPAWLQDLTLIVPVRWAVDGLDAMTWRGLEFIVAAQASAVLLGFALLFAALAWWRFDWRE